MNSYFKFHAESDLGIGIQYIEFDDDNWPIRQVECYGNRWFNSSRRYHKDLGGMGLCDQQLTEAGMELGDRIDTKEFELVWNLSNEEILKYQKTSENKLSDRLTLTSPKHRSEYQNTPRRERPSIERYERGRLNELHIRLKDLQIKLSIETSAEMQVILEKQIQQEEKLIKIIEYRELRKSLIRKQATRSKESPR
jgi:hypothetical protein